MARVGPWVSCSSAWAEHPSAAVGPCADSTASQPNPDTAAGYRQEPTVAAPAAAAGYLVISPGEAVRRWQLGRRSRCSSACPEHPSVAAGPCADTTACQPNPDTTAGQRQDRPLVAPAAAVGCLVISRGEALRWRELGRGARAPPLGRNIRRPLSAPALTRRPASPIRTRPLVSDRSAPLPLRQRRRDISSSSAVRPYGGRVGPKVSMLFRLPGTPAGRCRPLR